MLEYVSKHSDIRVERGKLPQSISIGEKNVDYPVSVSVGKAAVANVETKASRNDNDIHVEETSQVNGHSDETIRAKYVIGCDGAHSWVRKQFDIATVGDDSDIIWGVLDIVPITDFRESWILGLIYTSMADISQRVHAWST